MKKLILAAALFILAASAMGQQTKSNTKDFGPHAQSGEQLLTNTQCQSTFYVASPYVMEWCTSLNGNISHIQTPAGWEQIYFGAEGYGICDLSTHQAYYDWGQYGDSGNWGAATVTQPKGPSTFPLTITRTTSDGIFTLTQKFNQSTTPAVKVTMTLKNNAGGLGREVYLVRFADIDADTFVSNLFGYTEYSAWGTLDGAGGHGIIARAAPSKNWSFAGVVHGFQNPCSPTFVSAPYYGDGASYLTWVPQLQPGSSQTVNMEYRQF